MLRMLDCPSGTWYICSSWRECHGYMPPVPSQNGYVLIRNTVCCLGTNISKVFKIPEVKFLLVGSAASTSRSNPRKTLLLIAVPPSHCSWSPPSQKKGSYNLQRIVMVKSNKYLSLRKSSALSQDRNFRDAVVASTMLRVNAGSGM
jgi:hypothetical protein